MSFIGYDDNLLNNTALETKFAEVKYLNLIVIFFIELIEVVQYCARLDQQFRFYPQCLHLAELHNTHTFQKTYFGHNIMV